MEREKGEPTQDEETSAFASRPGRVEAWKKTEEAIGIWKSGGGGGGGGRVVVPKSPARKRRQGNYFWFKSNESEPRSL